MPGAGVTDDCKLFGAGARGTKLWPSGKAVSALNQTSPSLQPSRNISRFCSVVHCDYNLERSSPMRGRASDEICMLASFSFGFLTFWSKDPVILFFKKSLMILYYNLKGSIWLYSLLVEDILSIPMDSIPSTK